MTAVQDVEVIRGVPFHPECLIFRWPMRSPSFPPLFQAARRDHSLIVTLVTSNITIALEKWGPRKDMGSDVTNVTILLFALRSGLKQVFLWAWFPPNFSTSPCPPVGVPLV